MEYLTATLRTGSPKPTTLKIYQNQGPGSFGFYTTCQQIKWPYTFKEHEVVVNRDRLL